MSCWLWQTSKTVIQVTETSLPRADELHFAPGIKRRPARISLAGPHVEPIRRGRHALGPPINRAVAYLRSDPLSSRRHRNSAVSARSRRPRGVNIQVEVSLYLNYLHLGGDDLNAAGTAAHAAQSNVCSAWYYKIE
jgi:hypothetical protein